MDGKIKMPTISEPTLEAHQWTYSRVRAAFIRGAIGPVAFLVTCKGLGMSQSEAEAEVSLAKMEVRR